MVVYQNCGVPVRVQSSTVRKLAEADLSALQSMDPKEKRLICESSSFYNCTHEIFSISASTGSESSYYTKCILVDGIEERICVTVNLLSANDGSEREQVKCLNHLIGAKENYPVQATGETLEKVMAEAIEFCRETLKY
jgi:hypothetical protein